MMRHLIVAALLLPTSALAQDGPASPLNPLAALDKASLKGFVERPLFEPSRRPPVVAAPLAHLPPPAPVVMQPPKLRLVGIVEGAHSLSAIVHRGDTNTTETLHTGDRVGGWTIDVMPGILRATSGDHAFEYVMFRRDLQSGPAPVTPAAALPRAASPQ